MHTDKETLAAKVEGARRRADLSVRALSKKSGIPRTTLSNQLAGLVEFKPSTLARLSRHISLNLSADDLLSTPPRDNTAEVAA